MDEPRTIAAAVRDACLQRALDAYHDAGLRGLCAEGRWELAVDALRSLDLDAALAAAAGDEVGPRDGRDDPG